MEASDRAILAHVGRFRITLRRVLERSFLEGRASSNVVQRLRKAGLLERIPLNGSVTCYQLTRRATAQLSLPKKRGETLSPVSLQHSLAALWFSYFGPRRRHRLEAQELDELLGVRPPTGVYCIERDPKPRIYRLYVPGQDTSDAAIRKQVEERAAQLNSEPALASWVRTRHLAIAVLLPSEERRGPVNKLLKELTDRVHVPVEFAPHPTNLHEALRGIEGPADDEGED